MKIPQDMGRMEVIFLQERFGDPLYGNLQKRFEGIGGLQKYSQQAKMQNYRPGHACAFSVKAPCLLIEYPLNVLLDRIFSRPLLVSLKVGWPEGQKRPLSQHELSHQSLKAFAALSRYASSKIVDPGLITHESN